MQTNPAYSVVSLFSGALGMDIGLALAGLNPVVAQDFESTCVQTARANGHVAIHGNIRDLMAADPSCEFLLQAAGVRREDVFAIVGGPPCQSFSTAGKRMGVQDERGTLFNEFLQAIRSIRPRFFVMENVKGLRAALVDPNNPQEGRVLESILRQMADAGYSTVHAVLNAADYGAAQKRERLIIVGSRDGEPIHIPEPTHAKDGVGLPAWRTFDEVTAGVQPGPCAKYPPKTEGLMRYIPEGGNWRDIPKDKLVYAMGKASFGGGMTGFYRRLSRNRPAPTIVTSPTMRATMLGHPTEHRPLSVAECARIQGFPDAWKFAGSPAAQYRQIGNAVPVPLAEAIGRMLREVAEA